MYLLILILPLLSSIICGLWGRKIGYEGIKLLSCILIFFTFSLSVNSFIEVVAFNSIIYINLWSWFDIGMLYNPMNLQFDYIVSSMLILVSSVSFFVHIFSTSYMNGDPHLPRFMSYLSLFTFFMVVLVTSNNLIQLFIGWEGVGLCSYLLIGFWYTRIQANKSAIKAMIMNKVGDMALLLGIISIWIEVGSLDYNSIFSYCYFINEDNIKLDLISFFLLIGVIGKSAQFGLHSWLPDAMEGPTPVSALIHAATMVTAGVFLIIRMSPFFELTPTILLLIVLIGSLTAFFSSTIGLTQNDLKKVIAYSTCSQLGYMVMICGFSQYNSSLFHLINHGFFKALLFLSAGSIIHALNDEQDFRKMGSMNSITPFTYTCIVIGSVSLMGLPFLTGFYSKDLIIELIYGEHYLRFALWLGVLSAFLTAFYSFRLINFTFFNSPQSNMNTFSNSHEGDWNLRWPLSLLIMFSIIIGFILQHTILIDEAPIIITNISKFSPLIVSFFGASFSMVLGILISKWWYKWLNQFNIKLYSFTNNAWYFDYIFHNYISKYIFNFGLFTTYKLIDNQLLEYFGPYNSYNKMSTTSNKISKLHSGKLSLYLLIFLIFTFFLIIKI
uniref:NADH-ubiquinone oxidoreductase chain 5 n=2 Tax=Obeliidae TaxID=2750047 RepID=G9ISS5_LAOFL|nr:NADH dehydrogenase subunit 5 [Laomedea flexuosa]AER54614.1 NADH dehydrogenase subunit 5 [Obelia longissima]